MAGKCDECKVNYVQFQATCYKNTKGYYQTKRYYRCPKCGTIYVESDPVQDENYHNGIMTVAKLKPIKKDVQTTLI